MLLRILGSRKPVLFVEGEHGSIDQAVFRAVYAGWLIVARGNADKVIEATKALRGIPQLHHLRVAGIIDRDFRSDDEIAALTSQGLRLLGVAEVENLLCLEGVVRIVAARLELDVEEKVAEMTAFVTDRLREELEVQASALTAEEVAFRMNLLDMKARGADAIKQSMGAVVGAIDVEAVFKRHHDELERVAERRDLLAALRRFNRKSLPDEASRLFDLGPGGYRKLVLRILGSDEKGPLVDVLRSHLPRLDEDGTPGGAA
jgi:hypothetical protein